MNPFFRADLAAVQTEGASPGSLYGRVASMPLIEMARTITPRLNCPDEAYDALVKLRVIHHHVSHEVDALKDGASSVTGPVPENTPE